jgi:hypothetical protein
MSFPSTLNAILWFAAGLLVALGCLYAFSAGDVVGWFMIAAGFVSGWLAWETME